MTDKPGRAASDRPVKRFASAGVNIDCDRLAHMHASRLGFLEVGGHVKGMSVAHNSAEVWERSHSEMVPLTMNREGAMNGR